MVHNIDYKSVISLGRPVVDQTNGYLEEKEAQLARLVLDELHIPAKDYPVLAPPPMEFAYGPGHHIHLTESLDAFQKRIEHEKRRKDKKPIHQHLENEWKESLGKINTTLEEYVEVLQETSEELFHQTAQLGLEEWQPELMTVVDTLRKVFERRFEELLSSLKRFDHLLHEYSKSNLKKRSFIAGLVNPLRYKKSFLAPELMEKVNKSQARLRDNFKKFKSKYEGFESLKSKSEEFGHRLDWYTVLHGLEANVQESYKKIFQLLKMNEINDKQKVISQEDMAWNLRSAATPDTARELFKLYSHHMHEALYKTSRVIKMGIQDGHRTPQEMQEDIESYRKELTSLRYTIENYRKVIPKYRHDFLKMEQSLKNLDDLYVQMNQEMLESLSLKPEEKQRLKTQLYQLLREMSQPLISREQMKKMSHTFLTLMEKCHELGSPDLEIFDLVGDCLSKAMRVDWKYHVLPENKTFNRFFEIHCRIWGLHGDRGHLIRKKGFLQHFRQIETLLKDTQKPHHDHDLEMEMIEIKASLQSFLAYLQSLESHAGANGARFARLLNQAQFQLLKYRYIFSTFFWHLLSYEIEGRLLRKQLLFVDQYFDTMESKINALKQGVSRSNT